jgi:hypothetical protein
MGYGYAPLAKAAIESMSKDSRKFACGSPFFRVQFDRTKSRRGRVERILLAKKPPRGVDGRQSADWLGTTDQCRRGRAAIGSIRLLRSCSPAWH